MRTLIFHLLVQALYRQTLYPGAGHPSCDTGRGGPPGGVPRYYPLYHICACGCKALNTVQAGIIGNELSAEEGIIITDVCPYTLGTSVLDYVGGIPVTDAYDVLIPRNVTIPVVREKIYGTVAHNQTQVEIDVYQGEYRKASQNNFLGKFLLKGIPPAPPFQEKISISFAYDLNGILQVEGKIVSTGKKANLVIETTGVEMEKEIDLDGWDKAPAARKYRAIIRKASRMVENGEALHYAPEMESLIHRIKVGLVQDEDGETLERFKEELHDIIYELAEEADD